MVFTDVNLRLLPGSLPDLGGKYPEILGPIYRFDLNMKKTDWLLQQNKPLGKDELSQLDDYINTMEGSSGYVATQKKALLDSWFQKPTFDERIGKLNEIKAYRAALAAGNKAVAKPELAAYLQFQNRSASLPVLFMPQAFGPVICNGYQKIVSKKGNIELKYLVN